MEPEKQNQTNPDGPQIDQMKYDMLMRRLQSEQNMSMAIFAGSGAALAGAVVWAVVTSLTGYQIGFMAIGIGFIVGYAVRSLGHGVDKQFGIVGAAMSLAGCLTGNLLVACIFVAEAEKVELTYVLSILDFSLAVELLTVAFSPMDLLFYGFAIYYGYKLSIRQMTEQDLQSVVRG